MFKKMIEKLEARRAELVTRSNKSESLEEVRSINQQIQALNEDIEEARAKQTQYEAEQREAKEQAEAANKAKEEAEARAAVSYI